jgi:L-threonylcarbamoyladenylate synthase
MPIIHPSTDQIERAARILRGGGLVAMPTETVYGLAADATNGRAVASLYALKGRPRFNPLIAHVASFEAAHALAYFSPMAERLARAFWPGPLTLVLAARAANGIADLVTAGLTTLAIRVPAHPVARALIEATGRPIAAPSANRSGRISPTTAQHVASEFGADLEFILDGGATRHGLESTIINVSGEELILLRPGAIAASDLEHAAGRPLVRRDHDASAPSAPGQLNSHYAPTARVRLDARDVGKSEALLAFGPDAPPTVGPMINLSQTGDLVEAAHGLFAALRALDASGASVIAVMPIPPDGLGEAINDRLTRAAAPRGA